MEFKILKDFDNRLMKRREVIVEMDYGGGATPSKGELQLLFAKKFAVDPERVEISKIFSNKGYSSGKIWIKIWDEPKVEVILKEKREGKEEKEEKTETEESKGETSQEEKEEGEEVQEKSEEKGSEEGGVNGEEGEKQEQA